MLLDRVRNSAGQPRTGLLHPGTGSGSRRAHHGCLRSREGSGRTSKRLASHPESVSAPQFRHLGAVPLPGKRTEHGIAPVLRFQPTIKSTGLPRRSFAHLLHRRQEEPDAGATIVNLCGN